MSVNLRHSRNDLLLALVLVLAGWALGVRPCGALQENAGAAHPPFRTVSYSKLSGQIDRFFNQLIKIPPQDPIPVFDKHAPIIAEKIDRQRLYYGVYEAVAALLDRAAEESVDALTLFTLPPLQDPGGMAIIFDKALLEKVARNYDFHGLFNITTPALEDGAAVKMTFLISKDMK